jgi:hypothetical protein
VAMMECDPHAIDIFTDAFSGTTKYRLCVGYAIGEHLYCMKKLSMIDSQPDVVHPTPGNIDICRRAYVKIDATGELVLPVYGYDLGEPHEYDDDGELIGDWPQLGTMTISYRDKFLMPGGKLPEGYTHLRQLRW